MNVSVIMNAIGWIDTVLGGPSAVYFMDNQSSLGFANLF